MSKGRDFRKRMSEGPILLPGCWDVLSAKIIESAGFPAACITGGGVSQTLIGRADYGYITQTEMLDVAGRISPSVRIPVIADIDDGFGHLMSVKRTIEIAERIGLAGVHIEDVAPPKRCPELGGSTLIPTEDMFRKIEVARDSIQDPDFLLVVRTDNYEGIDRLITRAGMYEKAGADLIMPLGITNTDDLKRLSDSISIPLWYGQIGGGSGPRITLEDAGFYNIGVLAFTLEGFTSAYEAHRDYLVKLKKMEHERSSRIDMGPSFSLINEYESVCGSDSDKTFQDKFFKNN